MRSPCVALLLCAPSLSQHTQLPLAGDAPAAPQTAPYRVLDTVEGHWLDLALMPVRPLARDAQTGHLYALDAHGDNVVEFDAAGAHVRTIATPWGPVALSWWAPTGGGLPSLLVVTRGSYALARIDLASGALVGLVALPTEPADVLVHPVTNRAFVACSGDDSVVEVDIELGVVVGRYAIPSKRPTFLALDGSDVLVAPMLSGNNSMADTGTNILDVGPGRVLDLEDAQQAQSGLADHDLFRITPAGAVEPRATDMGAVLFALGVNPASGEVWQLGTEARNKDPLLVGEPALRGNFVVNQLARAALVPGSVVAPLAVHDLDDSDPGTTGVQYDSTRTVGQPYALAFDASGAGFVTGLLTDNVTQLSPTGTFVREWDVGSIPRGVLVDSAGTNAAVHCWGTNTVELLRPRARHADARRDARPRSRPDAGAAPGRAPALLRRQPLPARQRVLRLVPRRDRGRPPGLGPVRHAL
jgi:DNA-binding beta-propeller fold protein YncE